LSQDLGTRAPAAESAQGSVSYRGGAAVDHGPGADHRRGERVLRRRKAPDGRPPPGTLLRGARDVLHRTSPIFVSEPALSWVGLPPLYVDPAGDGHHRLPGLDARTHLHPEIQHQYVFARRPGLFAARDQRLPDCSTGWLRLVQSDEMVP